MVYFMRKKQARWVFWGVTAVLIAMICIGIWMSANKTSKQTNGGKSSQTGGAQLNSPSFIDEASAKAQLKRALVFEMLTIYEKPEEFEKDKRGQLGQYWVPAEQGGEEVSKIEQAVANLLARGWHYRDDSRCESLEFVSVTPSGESMDIETREHWYVPVIDKTGKLVLERNTNQRWDIVYGMRKINGSWLIEKSNGPYVKH